MILTAELRLTEKRHVVNAEKRDLSAKRTPFQQRISSRKSSLKQDKIELHVDQHEEAEVLATLEAHQHEVE